MRFLHNIRKKMFDQSELGKYIPYALGEICLLVIGILIALNVNNMNEKNKKINQIKDIIYDVQHDLKRDTIIFGRHLRDMKDVIEWKTEVLTSDIQSLPLSQINSMIIDGYSGLKINDGAFTRLQYFDNSGLEKYQDILKYINFYYKFNRVYMENFNDWEMDMYEKEFDFWTQQNQFEIDFNDSIPFRQNDELRQEEMLKFIGSNQGRNNLRINLMREKVMYGIYMRTYTSAKTTLLEIDDLLSKE